MKRKYSQWDRLGLIGDGLKIMSILCHNKLTVRQISDKMGFEDEHGAGRKRVRRWIGMLETLGAPVMTEDSEVETGYRPAQCFWVSPRWVRDYFNFPRQ